MSRNCQQLPKIAIVRERSHLPRPMWATMQSSVPDQTNWDHHPFCHVQLFLTVCSDEFWPSIFLPWKKYMILTPEFKYKSSGILGFSLCNHSPKWFFFQKSTCIVHKKENYSLILQNCKRDFGIDYAGRNQVHYVICI